VEKIAEKGTNKLDTNKDEIRIQKIKKQVLKK
jgi:hypothetical protein